MNRKKYEKQAEGGAAMLKKVMDGKTVTTQEMPKPMPYLTSGGKKIFKAICAHLIEHNILCSIDGLYVSLISHNMDIYNRMMAMIEKKESEEEGSGYFQIFDRTGAVQNSPYFNAANKAFDIVEKGCAKLGLTPKSRDSILAFAKVGEPEDDDDELDLAAKVRKALASQTYQS